MLREKKGHKIQHVTIAAFQFIEQKEDITKILQNHPPTQQANYLYATPQACCIYSITATAPHFNN
jgi:hypothetical protein